MHCQHSSTGNHRNWMSLNNRLVLNCRIMKEFQRTRPIREALRIISPSSPLIHFHQLTAFRDCILDVLWLACPLIGRHIDDRQSTLQSTIYKSMNLEESNISEVIDSTVVHVIAHFWLDRSIWCRFVNQGCLDLTWSLQKLVFRI